MKNSIKARRLLRGMLWHGQRVVNWLRNKLLYARDARVLNRQLFADVDELDEEKISDALTKMRESCISRGYDKEQQQNWDTHVYRLLFIEQWLAEILKTTTGNIKIIDLGVQSIASDYWRTKFPGVLWENTNYDLRFSWQTTPSSADLVLCTELVEHLSDPVNEQSFNEGFYKLGFIALLRESHKAIKPGGYLLLTTPNATSVYNLREMLRGKPPWFFIKHVREYTMNEVVELLKNTGFEVVRKRDIHCMTVMAYADYVPIFQLLLENGFPVEGRGDDLFVLARKPV